MASRYWRIGLAALLTLGLACSESDRNSPTGGNKNTEDPILSPTYLGEFELAFGESATFESDGTVIRFAVLVSDSRCPIGVYCFWEGEATIGLEVKRKDSASCIIELPIIGDGYSPVAVDTFGYRFVLDGLAPYPIYPDSIPLAEYVATIYAWPLAQDDSLTGRLIIEDNSPDTYQVHGWRLDSARIVGDRLSMSIHHSGGCGEHQFDLFMSPAAFMESYPVQANIYLRHIDLNDPCDAIVGKELTFDLTPAVELYRQGYGSYGPIWFNLYPFFVDQPGEPVRLLFDPREVN